MANKAKTARKKAGGKKRSKSASRKSRVRKAATKKAAKKKTAKKKPAKKKAVAKKAAKKTVKKTVAKRTAAKKTAAPKRAVNDIRISPAGGAAPSLPPAPAVGVVDQIVALAAQSRIAQYQWLDDSGRRGKAPMAYFKGMAVVYARVYCKLKAGDPAAVEMARKKTTDAAHDVLASYDATFTRLGMSNDQDGVDTLRHLFVLLTGLGVRESSGYYCRGRYMAQGFSSASDAEAGLFQTAYNLQHFCPSILDPLIQHYLAHPSGFVEIFSAGITCGASDWKNWGDPNEIGYKVQQLTKTCPAFAAEFAAVGMRHSLSSWGTLRRKTPEVVPDCETLFKGVEAILEGTPGFCSQLL